MPLNIMSLDHKLLEIQIRDSLLLGAPSQNCVHARIYRSNSSIRSVRYKTKQLTLNTYFSIILSLKEHTFSTGGTTECEAIKYFHE